jgi:CPA1 family monovalent cation:H+ antiporter
MLFGALISPTDPVSVLALFKEANAPEDLKVLVEGESLFNDATGVVLFTILFEAVLSGGHLSLSYAALEFVKVSAGGLALGAALGIVAFWVMKQFEEPLLENAICLLLAYGAFWLAEVIHVSGVIATVMAGLLMGNFGRRLSMGPKTTETIETFFESIDFLINSFLFILIGLELREIPREIPWLLVFVAIAAMLIGRAVVTYTFYWVLNQFGRKRPKAFKHILFWGGLRGSIPIALLLQLSVAAKPSESNLLIEYRSALIVAGFSCVFFSLVVQGITMKPLMKFLKIGQEQQPDSH